MTNMARPLARLTTLTGWKLWLNVTILCIGLFLSALETTIIATALVSIGNSLGDYHRSSWVVTSYLLTYTGFLTILARCSDVFGRKPIFLMGLAIFTAASLACGLATTMTQLIVFRAFQGLGGAGIYSLALRVLTEIPDKKTMGPVAGLIGVVFACSSIVGPLLGGAIVSSSSWKWVFLLNVPAGGLLIVLAIIIFPKNETPMHNTFKDLGRVDWGGCVFSLGATILLIFALESGGGEFEWNSAPVVSTLVAAGVCLILFILWEAILARGLVASSALPVYPAHLVRNWKLSAALLISLLIGFPFMITIIYLPQAFQVAGSRTAVRAGIDMIPLLIFSALGSGLGGAISSRKPIEREILAVSFALQLIGLGLVSSVNLNGSVVAEHYVYESIVGLGFGFSLSSITIVARHAVAEDSLSVAMGLTTQIRVLGGLVGIGCTQSLLNKITSPDLGRLLDRNERESLRSSIQNVRYLSLEQQGVVRETYARGYKAQIYVSLGIAAAGLFLALAMVVTSRIVHDQKLRMTKEGEDAANELPIVSPLVNEGGEPQRLATPTKADSESQSIDAQRTMAGEVRPVSFLES